MGSNQSQQLASVNLLQTVDGDFGVAGLAVESTKGIDAETGTETGGDILCGV